MSIQKNNQTELELLNENVNVESGALALSQHGIQSVEQRVKEAEKYFELHDKIRMLSIKMTSPNDWIDQAGRPYMEYTGATKIAKAFGVKIYGEDETKGPKMTKDVLADDKGDYYIYKVEGCAEWNKIKQPQIGMCSTRDGFFGKTAEGYKPLSEVDLTNVQKKAYTNFLNRVIKTLLGLSFTWEEIEEMSGGKITRGKCTSFTYATGSRGGKNETKEAGEKKKEFAKKLMEKCSGDKILCETVLEIMTRYKDKPGKKSFKQMTEKQVDFLLKTFDQKVNDAFTKMESEKIEREADL